MLSHILKVRNVSKSFGGLASLVDVSLTINHGDIFAIIGPNGAGKSTLFNCISGFYWPDRGSITFKEVDITGWKPHDIAKLGIYRTFQNIGLFKSETVLKNMVIAQHLNFKSGLIRGALLCKSTKEEEKKAEKNAFAQLEMLNIRNVSAESVSNLSFGNQKLLELACALIQRPKLLLLDEPTSGLDPLGTREMKDLILRLRDEGKTVVMCSHLLADVQDVCDRIAILHQGELKELGRVDTLLTVKDMTQVRAESLTKEAEEEIRAVIEKHGGNLVAMENPTTTLEELFLNIVRDSDEKPGRRSTQDG